MSLNSPEIPHQSLKMLSLKLVIIDWKNVPVLIFGKWARLSTIDIFCLSSPAVGIFDSRDLAENSSLRVLELVSLWCSSFSLPFSVIKIEVSFCSGFCASNFFLSSNLFLDYISFDLELIKNQALRFASCFVNLFYLFKRFSNCVFWL